MSHVLRITKKENQSWNNEKMRTIGFYPPGRRWQMRKIVLTTFAGRRRTSRLSPSWLGKCEKSCWLFSLADANYHVCHHHHHHHRWPGEREKSRLPPLLADAKNRVCHLPWAGKCEKSHLPHLLADANDRVCHPAWLEQHRDPRERLVRARAATCARKR